MTSADRLVELIKLFTARDPLWTVERAAAALGVSLSTAYRYVRSLVKAGVLESHNDGGSYVLGPAIIELDRTIRVSDPVLAAARPTMQWLAGQVGAGGVVLLCRLFQDKVMCIHQEHRAGPDVPVTYERGLPLPMFRGAASKIIFAHLPPRRLRRLHERHAAAIAEAALGDSFETLSAHLRALRRSGVCVSRGELEIGTTGIAVPVFSRRRQVLGSLSVAYRAHLDELATARLTALLKAGGREVDARVDLAWNAQAAAARREAAE